MVRAPFAGVVTVKAAQVGEIVSPLSAGGGFTRTGVGTIVDMDSLEVDVDVNEAYIGQVKPDMPAEAVLDAYPDWKIPAHVIAIVPAADRGKATVKVRVALEQKDARIVPDMGVRVSLPRREAGCGAGGAGAEGRAGAAAGVVQRDGAQRRVRRRRRQGAAARGQARGAGRRHDEAACPRALKAGERVVLSPPAALRDGASVKDRSAALNGGDRTQQREA